LPDSSDWYWQSWLLAMIEVDGKTRATKKMQLSQRRSDKGMSIPYRCYGQSNLLAHQPHMQVGFELQRKLLVVIQGVEECFPS